jgi:hypothetical protein
MLALMDTMAAVALVWDELGSCCFCAAATAAEPAGLAVASVAELVEPAVASVAELAAEIAVGPAVASVAQPFAYPASLGPASFWPIPLMPSHLSSFDPW